MALGGWWHPWVLGAGNLGPLGDGASGEGLGPLRVEKVGDPWVLGA